MPKGYACNLAKNTPEIKKANVDEKRSTNLKICTPVVSQALCKMNPAVQVKVEDEANGT